MGLSSSDEESDDSSLDSSFFDFFLLSRCACVGISLRSLKNIMSTYPCEDLFGRNRRSMLCTGYRRYRFFGVNSLDLFDDFGLDLCLGLRISLFFSLLVGLGHRKTKDGVGGLNLTCKNLDRLKVTLRQRISLK